VLPRNSASNRRRDSMALDIAMGGLDQHLAPHSLRRATRVSSTLASIPCRLGFNGGRQGSRLGVAVMGPPVNPLLCVGARTSHTSSAHRRARPCFFAAAAHTVHVPIAGHEPCAPRRSRVAAAASLRRGSPTIGVPPPRPPLRMGPRTARARSSIIITRSTTRAGCTSSIVAFGPDLARRQPAGDDHGRWRPGPQKIAHALA